MVESNVWKPDLWSHMYHVVLFYMSVVDFELAGTLGYETFHFTIFSEIWLLVFFLDLNCVDLLHLCYSV